MKFIDHYIFREERFSTGIEEDSGRHYLSIPVSSGTVDYEEYYSIDKDMFDRAEVV
jgi:hypothetical protein